jgi:choline dehydrogenase-like flavoprotein
MAARRRVLVIGGGISGCAAARAAARAGAAVTLVEAQPQLGGVVVSGDHRTLCGFAAIAEPTAAHPAPRLLEPHWQQPWLDRLATGPAFRRGRVWLWPTAGQHWPQLLAAELAAAGVRVIIGSGIDRVTREDDGWRWRLGAHGPAGRLDAHADLVIDTADAHQRWHLPARAGAQWGAVRGVVAHPGWNGLAARSRALRTIAAATGWAGAATWEALAQPADGHPTWQLSVDVPPTITPAEAADAFARAAAALGARVVSAPRGIASRDDGGLQGSLTGAQLFAQRQRGACWGAWPVEAHTATGVSWRWPPGRRYGVPWSVCRPSGLAAGVVVLGRGLAVQPDAQAALRVTGTAVALAGRVGRALVRRDADWWARSAFPAADG